MSEQTPQTPQEWPALTRAAQITSDVFSPLLIPTYIMALCMWITPLSQLSERTRLLSTLAIFFITTVVPLCTILLLIRLGKVSDRSISNRRERPVPYAVSILCYLGATFYLYTLHAPEWLWAFFLGAAVSSLLALIITNWWKISAHTTGIGGAVGIFAAMIKLRILDTDTGLLWLSAAVLLCGWLGTSRLILHRHTPAQVYAGMLMGALTEYATILLA